jgi:hypothetical protein
VGDMGTGFLDSKLKASRFSAGKWEQGDFRE